MLKSIAKLYVVACGLLIGIPVAVAVPTVGWVAAVSALDTETSCKDRADTDCQRRCGFMVPCKKRTPTQVIRSSTDAEG